MILGNNEALTQNVIFFCYEDWAFIIIIITKARNTFLEPAVIFFLIVIVLPLSTANGVI